MFDDPWTPVDQRMPLYPSGFVAFAPSPGPNVDFSYAQYGTSVPPSPETSKSSQSQEKRTRSGRTSSTKRKEREQGWEHVVVAQGGLLKVSEISEEEPRRPTGCRTGGLDPKTKEKARRIRKVGACWSCWVQKVPVSVIPRQKPPRILTTCQCSEGEPCTKCRNVARKQSLLVPHQLCWRSGFKDYESTFFPGNIPSLFPVVTS
jgi:hypothetical protein